LLTSGDILQDNYPYSAESDNCQHDSGCGDRDGRNNLTSMLLTEAIENDPASIMNARTTIHIFFQDKIMGSTSRIYGVK
jgi:hypothetical protein